MTNTNTCPLGASPSTPVEDASSSLSSTAPSRKRCMSNDSNASSSSKRPCLVSSSSDSSDSSDSETTASRSNNNKTTQQARYTPPNKAEMTKAELAAWRKEARRVRNRESAAASRRKTRERIEELEETVSTLRDELQQALATIERMKKESPQRTMEDTTAATEDNNKSPITIKTVISPASSPLRSPREEPEGIQVLPKKQDSPEIPEPSTETTATAFSMIPSRPIAWCR